MTVDASKVQFYSGWPIDKIFAQDTLTFTMPACTDPVNAPVLRTITAINPYGSAGLVTSAYSIDGTNFYGQDATIYYFDTVTSQIYPELTVLASCSDSTIFFLVTSTFRSILNVTINYAVDSIS